MFGWKAGVFQDLTAQWLPGGLDQVGGVSQRVNLTRLGALPRPFQAKTTLVRPSTRERDDGLRTTI